jgi:phage-related protein
VTALAENYVEVTVKAKDDTGPGFAEADAKTKAFEAAMTRSFASQARAAKLLNDPLVQATQDEEKWKNAVVDADGALHVLADTTGHTTQKQGFLSRAMGGVARALDGGSGQGGLIGSLFGAAGVAEKAGSSLGTMGTIIVPLIGLVGALTIALTPFLAGLTVAAAGVVGFAAIAIPEISKVIQARQALTAAEQKYDAATTSAQRKTALKAEAQATAGLTAQQKELMKPLGELSGMFSRLEKAVNPTIMTAFGTALKIIKTLMPDIKTLLVAAGQALDGFLKNIDNWLHSPSGQKFIHWLAVEGPMAMRTFGHDLWDTAKVVGNVFHFMYDTGETFDRHWSEFWHTMAHVVDSARTGFTQLGHMTEHLADSFRIGFTQMGHQIEHFVDSARTGFTQMGHLIEHLVDSARIGFTQMGHFIESIWNATVSAVISTGARVTGWFQALPGRLLGYLAALPSMLFQAGVHAVEGLINGLLSEAGALGSAVSSLASKVAGFFGLSPAKEGPLSGAGAPEIRGRHFADALAAGIRSGTPGAGSAAGGLASALAPGGGAAGGGGVLRLQLEWAGGQGDSEFMTWLSKNIRIRGGDPRILTQKVSTLT